MNIRLMQPADLSRILAIQSACYPAHLHEAETVLAGKQQCYPQSCWVAETPDGLSGYLFAHPWHLPLPPALDAVFPEGFTGDTAYFFMHDLAVHPAARGLGLAQALWREGLRVARTHGCAEIRLVAVAGAASFWHRLGFVPVAGDFSAKLAAYGPAAVVLRLPLLPADPDAEQ